MTTEEPSRSSFTPTLGRNLGLAAPAQAATAGNAPTVVASAIDILPTEYGHHAWVVDIQPHANVPHR
jgi:hypothetical protein